MVLSAAKVYLEGLELICASVSSQTITNGNVSEAEAMVARVASSRSLVQRLQAGGLAVVHVMLVSCEPLDPSALPVRLRPQIINFTLPGQGKRPVNIF